MCEEELDPSHVPIPNEAIHWVIKPSVEIVNEEMVVKLTWGWGDNFDENGPLPNWHVKTSLEFAEELRDNLTELISEYKAQNEELRAARDRKFDEKYPNFNEKLEALVKKQEEARSIKAKITGSIIAPVYPIEEE